MNMSSLFLSIFIIIIGSSPPFFLLGICKLITRLHLQLFFMPRPSHKPKGNCITTFGSSANPFCTCGPSSRSAFSSSCMLPWGQWEREDLRGVLDVVPHPACQPYRLSGPNVHSLALAYIWLVICLWAESTQTQSTNFTSDFERE